MRGNLGIDHLALALAHRGHVDGDGTRHGAELRGVAHQIRDLRAPNLILTRQAVNVGTGAPIYRRSTTAVRRPDRAISQARSLPPLPLPRIRISNRSG